MFSRLYSTIVRHLHTSHCTELTTNFFLLILADLEHCPVRHGHIGKIHAFYIVKIHKIGLVYPYKAYIAVRELFFHVFHLSVKPVFHLI